MNTRILFTDLDGTLLNDQKEITPKNQAAIDEALARGHKIVISTGRPLASARIQAERLGLTKEGCYAITYNGGQIYDTCRRETIYGKTLSKDFVAPLFAEAHRRGIHIHTYDDKQVITEQETPEVQKYCKNTLMTYRVVEDAAQALQEDPYKIILVSYDDHEKLLRFQDEVLSQYMGVLSSLFSNDFFLEIVPVGISKGFAVHWMCEFLGIPLENSVAAGDAQNDIAMLEAANIGAVMCNAFPGIAEHGNYVTTRDNNHDGVAEIIEKFILI